MENLLQQVGLNDVQAKTYLYLLKQGESAPPQIAKALDLTRSNAYKVLEKLFEMQLIARAEVRGKFVYKAEDPIALTGIVATERNRLLALEQGIRDSLQELRRDYEKSTGEKDVRSYHGNQVVASLYEHQTGLKQPIYFIKTRADIPVMGHETMSKLRSLPAKVGAQRYGITQDCLEASANPAIDRENNLTRTWIHNDDYTAPVEWTVSGHELMIVCFEHEASAIRVKNKVVARAFKELWQLLDRSIRKDPGYKKLPRQAKRKV
ncbi:MAG TPA: helix-turn-helix domain-containing protein [Candidatus Saccharimonadales bacterium]|jgi:predicted transcriptional regulator